MVLSLLNLIFSSWEIFFTQYNQSLLTFILFIRISLLFPAGCFCHFLFLCFSAANGTLVLYVFLYFLLPLYYFVKSIYHSLVLIEKSLNKEEGTAYRWWLSKRITKLLKWEAGCCHGISPHVDESRFLCWQDNIGILIPWVPKATILYTPIISISFMNGMMVTHQDSGMWFSFRFCHWRAT